MRGKVTLLTAYVDNKVGNSRPEEESMGRESGTLKVYYRKRLRRSIPLEKDNHEVMMTALVRGNTKAK